MSFRFITVPAFVLTVAALAPGARGATTVVLNPTDSLAVSDQTTMTTLGTVTPGTGAAYPVRSRAGTSEDALEVLSFLQFDLSSLPAGFLTNAALEANFVIDYTTRLNTINPLAVLVGRNSSGNWDSGGSNNPLHDWGFVDETSTVAAADGVTLVANVLTTAPFSDVTADVTPIVSGWGSGTNPNDGFVLTYSSNSFQGAGFDNARLVLTIPEPSRALLLGLGLGAVLLRRQRRSP